MFRDIVASKTTDSGKEIAGIQEHEND